MATVLCTINNRWMWSLESACIGITSPSGKTVWIDKTKFGTNGETQAQKELIWKIAAEQDSIRLTMEEMLLLKATVDIQTIRNVSTQPTIGQSPIGQRPQQKPLTLAQRKRRSPAPGNIRAGICGCSGKLRMRNHGTWTGYHCPKCGDGGSFNN